MPRRRPPLAILVAVLAAASCGKTPSAPSSDPVKPNLVLITMDTTRADHLGCYGDAAAATPSLDALAREGALFDQAIAVAPLTLPSHVSMLTSLYPVRHGVRDNADFRLSDKETTLAEHLKSQGYRTAASVGAYMLASDLGLAQGFDAYHEPKRRLADPMADPAGMSFVRIAERPAAAVASDALEDLAGMKSGPFFLWVHFYDPHRPYTPPEAFARRFPSRPYDAEIASMDSEIGRIVEQLKAAGVYDRTIVAAIADHGESLGEHGEQTHGLFLYDATLRVPLIVRYPPKVRAGLRYPGLTSGVDLAPTLLELMGLPPLPGAQGRSVAAALAGGTVAEREPVYAESLYGERAYGWSPLFALRTSREKFIEAPEPEIYDVVADRGETANLAASRSAEVSTWKDRLASSVRSFGEPDGSTAAAMTDEQREALKSLGYVSAGAPGLARKDRPDPKKFVAVNALLVRAKDLLAEGKQGEAEASLREALKADPQNPEAASVLGSLRFSKNDRAAGLAQLRAAAGAAPGVFQNQWNLGNALHLDGRFDEAAAAFRAALAINPNVPEARYALGNALAAAGHPVDAVKAYRDAEALGLTTPPLRTALGSALLQAGDPVGAEASLRAAVAADPKLADGWNQLGILLDKTGRRAEARSAFTSALQAAPDHTDARFNLARLRLLDKDLPGARADLDRLLARNPDYPLGRLLEANVCVAEGNRAGAKAALVRLIAMPNADAGLKDRARTLLAKLGN
jgi:choline-sulfatase